MVCKTDLLRLANALIYVTQQEIDSGVEGLEDELEALKAKRQEIADLILSDLMGDLNQEVN